MDVSYFDEEWVEIEDNWGDEDLIANVAGEFAEEAQQCISQPDHQDGLRKAFHNTLNSIKLYGLGAFIKTASIEEQSGAMSAIAQTLGPHATAQSAAHTVRSFARQLASDPRSPSNQAAIKSVTEYVSLRDISADNVSQPSENPRNRRSTKRFELEEYSELVTTALHDTFYTSAYLPCTCKGKDKVVCLSREYVCALRLDGYQHVPGDENHCFFDSVIAGKDDENCQWTPVQFQLPRDTREEARVGLPVDPADTKNESSIHKVSSKALDDFCKILTWNIRCFRIHITKNFKSPGFSWSKGNSFSTIFPRKGAPMLLSTALKQDELSARHKIFLAFTISKAFWQYYDSDWMNVEWSLETIQLLRTGSFDSEAPFLKIRSAESKDSTYCEQELGGSSGEAPNLHSYPYILNLGLLLVQLGSITPASITTSATLLAGTQKTNELCISCCTETANSAWPAIQLPDKDRSRYRRIVEECLPIEVPKPLFKEHLDAVGRRLALKDHVVQPLFELFQDMADPDETAFQLPNKVSVLQAEDGANKVSKTPSELAWDWLNNITSSSLHKNVFAKIKDFKRPKIAIIDTGFDSTARFVDRKLLHRLNMLPSTAKETYNWKDYWESEAMPQDNNGHGTAMLSIVHRIAPFADICVARIAGKDEDLRESPGVTSKKLAEAIIWAVQKQHADIVSLSLGWEEEQCVDDDRVISNAICDALSHQNQNLLIFAAASNRGGSKYELFPASHQTVFSIRGTNTNGTHEEFNPSLPEGEGKVYGTLGLKVPTSNRGRLESQYQYRDGTSVATAITAGIAAIVVGYINIHDKQGSWNNIRMFGGFQNLLYELSTEPEGRKRFITLDSHFDQVDFETALNTASNLKKGK